jgi:ABC-type metal ion transport system substrate-binding protein
MKNFTKKALSLILATLLVLSLASVSAETLQIGIPDDGTNLSRGIKLLETAGFIKVDPEAGYTPEIADITEYLYDIEIVPLAANTLPSVLEDFAGATINGTYATTVGLVPSRDGLLIEKQSEGGDNPYINIIVARTADKDNETYKTIVNAFQSQLVAEYMLKRYEEAFYPAFEYDENLTLTEEEVEEITAYRSNPEGKTTVFVGVCGTQNDHWIAVQKVLDDQGANIYIDLVVFDAYNLPNDALNAGEINLNSFQHKAYLQREINANGYDLVILGDTLIAPLTLYSNNYESIDAIKEAAGAK